TREKEELEGKLSRLSDYRAGQKEAGLSPTELSRLLPEGVVLVDYLVFKRTRPGKEPPRQRERQEMSAFVVRRDRAVVRVDLGAVAPVEEAVSAWRQVLGKKARASEAGALLRRLLWAPLEKHLAGAKVVLVSPDGPLARLPFAALPGGKEG